MFLSTRPIYQPQMVTAKCVIVSHYSGLLDKDKAVFVTKEDYENPEALSVVVNDEEYGIILPSGEINWDCPCLGGMAHGPCGEEFKSSFSCFHHSTEDPKGVDCIPQFKAMQECFLKYPDLYPQDDDDDEVGEPAPVSESNDKDKTGEVISTVSTSDELSVEPSQHTHDTIKSKSTIQS